MGKAYHKDKYDIGILRSDGTTNIGLMLVKKNNIPSYAVFDDEYLAAQFFTSTPGYGNLPAEKELAIRQESWRSGFGLNMYDSDDPERYFESQGMDMRFRGMAIAGPKPATLTKPIVTAAVIENEDMEDNSDWTGGSQSTDEYVSPTHSWMTGNSAGTGDKDAYQDVTAYYPNGTYTLTCWIKYNQGGGGAVAHVHIILDDGETETESAASTSATWTQLSVTKAVASGISRLRIILRLTVATDSGAYAKAYFDDVAFSVSPDIDDGVPASFAEFNDNLYVSFGKFVGVLNTDGARFNYLWGMPSNTTGMEPFGSSDLYIGNGYNALGYIMNVGEGFRAMGAGVNTFQFFTTVHSASPTLWGNVSAHQIRSTTSPTNALTWSGVTNVDANYNDITKLLSKSGALYVMKEDIPYYLDSVGAVQSDLAPELSTLERSTSNGKNALLWQNKLYMPWGDQALLEYDAGTNTWRNPADFCTNLSQFNGRVCAVAADDRYLYAVLDNGTNVYVLAGRLEYIGGSSVWVWHPIAEVPLSGCETAFISSVYQKRLYISSTNASEGLYYLPLPTGYGDVLTDTNASFATNVAMTTPWLHANFKDTEKSVIKLTTLLGHTYNTDVFFKAYYRTLENASYSFIGNAVGTPTSMVNTLYIPTAPTPTSTMFRLKFVANTLATDLTPVLLGYNLQALLYPPRRKIIMAQVRADQELTLKDGTADMGSKDVIAATLGEAREATWPVTLYNINGDVNYVKFLSPPSGLPFWEPTKMEKGRVMEARYNLVMQEVELS